MPAIFIPRLEADLRTPYVVCPSCAKKWPIPGYKPGDESWTLSCCGDFFRDLIMHCQGQQLGLFT